MNDIYSVHCPQCGYRVCRSASCTKTQLVCPRCGAELEVGVENKIIKIVVIHTKEEKKSQSA